MAVKPWWRETLETILWALVLALVLRTFVVQAFWIPSGSMIPTLQIKDRVLVCKFWYRFSDPKRGDIVVFKYPMDPKRDFVKRVVGLPGDTVELQEGTVLINGEPQSEPFVKNHDRFTMPALRVPDGSYFCMGDNRPNSQDSRFWGFVPESYLRGPVFFRYWPPNRIGLVD